MIEDRMVGLVSRLGAIRFLESSRDFVRFQREPADEQVSGVVREVYADGEEGGEIFRSRTAVDDGVLVLHARRRTLEAHRQLSLGLAMEALDAYSLDPSDLDLPWETWVLAALFIARRLGGDVAALEDRFSSTASQASAARIAIATDALNRVSNLEDCRITEVSTTYGTGFVENPELTDMPGRGLYAAPALGRERIHFSPRSNLAQLAVLLADGIDQSGNGVSHAILQDQIPSTLVPNANTGPYLRAAGCLRFMVDAPSDSFTVYVAEVGERDDARALAESATRVEGQWALGDASRLVVLSPQPAFDDGQSKPLDLGQFSEVVRTALGDASTR